MGLRNLVFACLVLAAPLAACSFGEDVGSLFRTPLATKQGTVDANEAASLISQYRASHGLGPVTIDPTLMKIAAVHAERMATDNQVAHILPGEGSFPQRLAAGGFNASAAAENIAAGQKSLADALVAWQKSPEHNANLLMPAVDKIGIALSIAPDSKYKTYWSLVLGQWYRPATGAVPMGALPIQNSDGTTVEIR